MSCTVYHLLQGDKLRANHRLCLPDQFFQSVGVLCLDARTPGHHSKEDGARHDRLIEHLQHLIADIEGPEPPKEVKPAQALLVDGLCVGGPVQFIVQCDTQVLVRRYHLHIRPTDADRREQGLVPPEVHHHLPRLRHVELHAVLFSSSDRDLSREESSPGQLMNSGLCKK